MPYYPPLHMSKPSDADRSFFDSIKSWLLFEPQPEEEHLQNQIKVRGPIPAEAWGNDPARVEFGRQIAELIAVRMDWPNANFIPEDPFEWVAYVIGGDGLEQTELVMALDETFGLDIDDVEWEMFLEWTLGEVVDYLRSGRISETRLSLASQALPLDGPHSLEARYCPKLAAFIDIRKFLIRNRTNQFVHRITPSTNARELNEDARRRLDWFIVKRFGTGATPIRPYTPIRTMLLSTSSTVAAAAHMGLLGGVIALLSGENLSWALWYAVFSAGIVVAVGVLVIAFQLISVLASRDYWRIRVNTVYRDVLSVGDLINWTISQRDNVRTQLSPE